MACIGLGEDGCTDLASNVLNPAAKARQPAHTNVSQVVWEWDADADQGIGPRMGAAPARVCQAESVIHLGL